MRKQRYLTDEQVADLHADLKQRFELQHIMAEHTRPVLELELGIDEPTIAKIERGTFRWSPDCGFTQAQADEAKRRRQIWQLTNERMQEYRLETLAERYEISVMSIFRHIYKVRAEMHSQERRMAA